MINKIWKNIKLYWKYGAIPPHNKLERHIFFTERAINRTKSLIGDLDWRDGYDEEYALHLAWEKLKRQEKALRIMNGKLNARSDLV